MSSPQNSCGGKSKKAVLDKRFESYSGDESNEVNRSCNSSDSNLSPTCQTNDEISGVSFDPTVSDIMNSHDDKPLSSVDNNLNYNRKKKFNIFNFIYLLVRKKKKEKKPGIIKKGSLHNPPNSKPDNCSVSHDNNKDCDDLEDSQHNLSSSSRRLNFLLRRNRNADFYRSINKFSRRRNRNTNFHRSTKRFSRSPKRSNRDETSHSFGKGRQPYRIKSTILSMKSDNNPTSTMVVSRLHSFENGRCETLKITHETHLHLHKELLPLKIKEWFNGFVKCDPRKQISSFFDILAGHGVAEIEKDGIKSCNLSPVQPFSRAKIFTVWRPTSKDAIRKLMLGEATGKALNVKGKSAKCGALSGFVPFLQIHSNNKHKTKISTLEKDARICVYFYSERSRDKAVKQLKAVRNEMVHRVENARMIIESLRDPSKEGNMTEEQKQQAYSDVNLLSMDAPKIISLDTFAPRHFGIDIPERLFWEGFVMKQDITRDPLSEMQTGRPSEPSFQDMCFHATREKSGFDPKTVVLQYNHKLTSGSDNEINPEVDPLDPLTLLVAYEEHGRVIPVASDFDGFMMGSKMISYKDELPSEQVQILKWCIDNISHILQDPDSFKKGWTSCWFEVLQKAEDNGFRPEFPQFGFGDSKSYSIMAQAVKNLNNGAVRHGAECFNYYFPQDLDEEFLVISSERMGSSPKSWSYMNVSELQIFLLDQIDKGYTFPLNPKWILCDQGWKNVYDKLCASNEPYVQNSLDKWYPPASGIRQKIEEIHSNHPQGFVTQKIFENKESSTHEMDLAELKLKRYVTLKRAKVKMRAIVFWLKIAANAEQRRALRLKES